MVSVERHCRKCGSTKPICGFGATTTRGSNCHPDAPSYRALRRKCRECVASYGRGRRSADRHYSGPRNEKGKPIPPAGAICALCPQTVKLQFDHDLTTERFRAWLCHSCNSGIMRGSLKELRAAYTLQLKHLRRHGMAMDEPGDISQPATPNNTSPGA